MGGVRVRVQISGLGADHRRCFWFICIALDAFASWFQALVFWELKNVWDHEFDLRLWLSGRRWDSRWNFCYKCGSCCCGWVIPWWGDNLLVIEELDHGGRAFARILRRHLSRFETGGVRWGGLFFVWHRITFCIIQYAPNSSSESSWLWEEADFVSTSLARAGIEYTEFPSSCASAGVWSFLEETFFKSDFVVDMTLERNVKWTWSWEPFQRNSTGNVRQWLVERKDRVSGLV